MEDNPEASTIVNMIADLPGVAFESTDEAAVLARAGVTLSNERGAGESEYEWIARSFGGRWPEEAEAGWNWFARDGEGRPVGFATYEQRSFRWWWLDRWFDQADVGIFGPMGVDRSLRKKRLGRILLRRSLRSLQARGFARALIGAVGPVEFYERWAGARVVERLKRQ